MHYPLVSVIVPIYNTEAYLPRCIESIQNQDYTNIEIVLVDDGSTDNSAEICWNYEKADKRMLLVRQLNQGIIAAKKAGLRHCHGEYIMFVDSDDWIEKQLLNEMLQQMLSNDCTLVCTNIFVDMKDTVVMKRNAIPAGVYETSKIAKNLFYFEDTDQYGILPHSVAKLYPKALLEGVMDRIGNCIHYAEDKAIVFGCVFQNIKVCFMEACYYHYCIRETSICQSDNPDYLIELTDFYKYARAIFEAHMEKKHLLRQLGDYILYEAGRAVNTKLGLTNSENPIYRKPYELDPSVFLMQKKDIVLYGAGRVGEDYQKALKDSININICGWVDKNFKKYQKSGWDVWPVESIKDIAYDYILVAIKKKGIFNEIKTELMSTGVEERKIIWGRPCGIV